MSVTASDILATMKEAGLAPQVVDRLEVDCPLLQQGLDSIDLPMIAVCVERRFGLDLSDADASRLQSVADFVSFVNARLESPGPPEGPTAVEKP